jgi:outer membrane protein
VTVAAPLRAETLADALALAYDSNPTLQAQRAAQRALDETYVQARTGWRPTLGLSFQATYEQLRRPRALAAANFSPTIVEANTGQLLARFIQPIWTGGRTAASVDASKADVLQGRENLRRVESQVLGQVIQAYADVRRDQAALVIQKENLTVLERQLEESNARFNVGEITRTDVALSQARLSGSQAQLATAIAQLASSRATYAALVGHNPADLAPEPSLAYLLPATVDEAFDVAEINNPTLRAQQYGEQASRARIALARANRMPSLSVTATYGQSGPVAPFVQERYARDVQGIATLSVPLFSGGLTSSQIRQQIERNNTDRITVETQRRAVLQSITQSWNLLTATRANIVSTQEQARAAAIATEGTRQEEAVGLRTTLDVLNAEQERRAAELNQLSARHDEFVAAAQLLLAMGRLEAKNLVPTVPRYDPKTNFRKLRVTWGWAPWEEPIGLIDHVLTPTPSPSPKEMPVEPAIGPGLDPQPTAITQPVRR